MTQLPLELTDEAMDTILLLALAAASPLAGTRESGAYLEAPDAPAAGPDSDAAALDDSVHLRETEAERYERECFEGDDAYARDVGVPRFGPI